MNEAGNKREVPLEHPLVFGAWRAISFLVNVSPLATQVFFLF